MPQIYIKLSPAAQRELNMYALASHALANMDTVVTGLILSEWGDDIDPSDIACSAEYLVYSRNEAAVQIEIRYTAGKHEGEGGKPFNPSMESQKRLHAAVHTAMKIMLGNLSSEVFKGLGLDVSVWTKGYENSHFSMAPEEAAA